MKKKFNRDISNLLQRKIVDIMRFFQFKQRKKREKNPVKLVQNCFRKGENQAYFAIKKNFL